MDLAALALWPVVKVFKAGVQDPQLGAVVSRATVGHVNCVVARQVANEALELGVGIFDLLRKLEARQAGTEPGPVKRLQLDIAVGCPRKLVGCVHQGRVDISAHLGH